MLYYIWVMKMASRYKFSDEEIKAIEQAREEIAASKKLKPL